MGALKDGELLTTNITRQALVDRLGDVADEKNVLIARVPRT